ncbi:MAG TPA: helix-turn-helix domain-containing protein [Terriglobales bacterium]|nr:helix-turn-helix domain-containing protein [Terriglobales bacterium]
MSELVDKLRGEFQDEEYRHAYADECLNTMIATQIKVLREQRDMTQKSLAMKTGMLQPRLSVLEDASYSSWSISSLRRLARAFDLTLKVSFESFTSFILDFESMGRAALERVSFTDDPLFKSTKVTTSHKFRKRQPSRMELAMCGQMSLFSAQIVTLPAAKPKGIDPDLLPSQFEESQQREEAINAAVVGGNG